MASETDRVGSALRGLVADWEAGDRLQASVQHRLRRRARRRRLSVVAAVAVIAGGAWGIAGSLLGGDDNQRRPVVAGEGDGDAQDPGSGWRSLPAAPIEPRAHAAAVWTGEEVLVWGGTSLDGGTAHVDGALYDPETDSWRRIADAPGGGRYTVAQWSGQELLLWGWQHHPDGGAGGLAYEPSSDRWRVLPNAPVPSRPDASGVWTGDELVVWGGSMVENPGAVGEAADGAAYDPVEDRWRPLPEAPLSGRRRPAMAWTGSEVLVVGGDAGDGASGRQFADGAAYDPVEDRWRPLADAPAPRSDAVLSWSGDEALLWGGVSGTGSVLDGARFDPAQDRWTQIPPLVEVDPGEDATVSHLGSVWAGDRLVAWMEDQDGTGVAGALAPGGWGDVGPAPIAPWYWPAMVWTGDEVVIWGGAAWRSGPRADEAGAAWRPPPTPVPSPSTTAADRPAPAAPPVMAATDLGVDLVVVDPHSATIRVLDGGQWRELAVPADGSWGADGYGWTVYPDLLGGAVVEPGGYPYSGIWHLPARAEPVELAAAPEDPAARLTLVGVAELDGTPHALLSRGWAMSLAEDRGEQLLGSPLQPVTGEERPLLDDAGWAWEGGLRSARVASGWILVTRQDLVTSSAWLLPPGNTFDPLADPLHASDDGDATVLIDGDLVDTGDEERMGLLLTASQEPWPPVRPTRATLRLPSDAGDSSWSRALEVPAWEVGIRPTAVSTDGRWAVVSRQGESGPVEPVVVDLETGSWSQLDVRGIVRLAPPPTTAG